TAQYLADDSKSPGSSEFLIRTSEMAIKPVAIVFWATGKRRSRFPALSSHAFSSDGRTLAAWARRTLAERQKHFDAHPTLTVQLEQLTGRSGIFLEEKRRPGVIWKRLTNW